MVLFTLTFLLATPYSPTPSNGKTPGKNKNKENILPEEEKNYKEFQVSKPTFTCRIEYCLYPNVLNSVDVTCWGDAATVTLEGKSASMETLVTGNLSWIHFRVKHEIEIDVPSFCDHKITFDVITNRKQSQIKGKILYGSKCRNYLFEPLFEDWEARREDEQIKVLAENGPHLKFVQDAVLDMSKETTLSQGGSEFCISGDTYFAGINNVKIGIRDHSEELKFLWTIAKAEKLLTAQQFRKNNLLSITINKLNGLPCEDLATSGVKSVKFRYSVCGNLIETDIFDVDEKIKINHSKTFLTSNLDFWGLIEFLQTKGLRIEIIGYDPEEVQLGIVIVDLSPLLYSPYRFRTKCDLKPPEVNSQLNQNDEFQPCYNVNDINSGMKDERLFSYLSTSCATMKVAARLLKQIKIPPKPANSLNRIVIILYDLTTAVHISNLIFQDFPDLVDHVRSGTQIKRPFSKYRSNSPLNQSPDTGFLINCVDKLIICIESTSFERIWESVVMIDGAKGQILCDGSLIFLNRLYQDFYRYGGFYIITLREPLEVLMSKPKTYIKGSLPFPARKALISLHQLIHCSSMKTACRNNLFPSPKSLYSLNIEFGVPLTSQSKLDE